VIDPLVAIIAYVQRDADLGQLVQGRIAAQHKFGLESATAWPTPSTALQIQLLGGMPPDLTAGLWRIRLDCRCYGESQRIAQQLHNALIALSDRFVDHGATTQETAAGLALIYDLFPEASPEAGFEQDVDVPTVRVVMHALVAKDAVL
jgi:hypothetical protein